MAEENTAVLPVINAVDGMTARMSQSNDRLGSIMSSGLAAVQGSIVNLNQSLSTLQNAQLNQSRRAVEQQAEQAMMMGGNQQDSSKRMEELFGLFLNFQNVTANKQTAQLIRQMENLTEETGFSYATMQKMFNEMGQILAGMNSKMADVAAHTMHLMLYAQRREKEKLAQIDPTRFKEEGMAEDRSDQLVRAITGMEASLNTTLARQEDETKRSSDFRADTMQQLFDFQKEQAIAMIEQSNKSREEKDALIEALTLGDGTVQSVGEAIKNQLIDIANQSKKEDKDDDEVLREMANEQNNIGEKQIKELKNLQEITEEKGSGGLLSGLGIAGGNVGAFAKNAGKWTFKSLMGLATLVPAPIAIPIVAMAAAMWYLSENKMDLDPEQRKEQLDKDIKTDIQDAATSQTFIGKDVNKEGAIRSLIEQEAIDKYGMTVQEANIFAGTKGQVNTGDVLLEDEEEQNRRLRELYEKMEAKYDDVVEKLFLEAKLKALREDNIPDEKQSTTIQQLEEQLQAVTERVTAANLSASPTTVETKNDTTGETVNKQSSEIADKKASTVIVDNSSQSSDTVVNNVNNGSTINVPVDVNKVKGTPAPAGLYDSYRGL